MRIRQVLRQKGDTVATVKPDSAVRTLLAVLAEFNIGAVVVSADGRVIAGIVSERDVVRQLNERGAAVLDLPVSAIMTSEVRTCGLDDTVNGVREIMTHHRFRHMPVVVDGALKGIVSIGDMVKATIDELEADREHLVGYIRRS